MIRRPPRSPLFPYTPLFRSGRKLVHDFVVLGLTNEGLKAGAKELKLPAESSPPVAASRGAIAVWVTQAGQIEDRKSTRLNSSHSQISYAVFCLKKKKTKIGNQHLNVGPRLARRHVGISLPQGDCDELASGFICVMLDAFEVRLLPRNWLHGTTA